MLGTPAGRAFEEVSSQAGLVEIPCLKNTKTRQTELASQLVTELWRPEFHPQTQGENLVHKAGF